MKSLGEILTEINIVLETPNPVLAHGFTQVPNFILRSQTLSVGAKLTYAMFLSYAWHHDYCYPGQKKLAEAIGVSRPTVNAFISELEAEGLIGVKRRGLGQTNFYTIRFTVRPTRPMRKSRLMSKIFTS